jgi:glycosyltransferase involved in cell wall biosynthesis
MAEKTRTSVSVILATFNRSESVAKTLHEFSRLDLEGIEVQFIVVANNCTDSTTAVLFSFKDRLPLVTLEEPTPGKNRALNMALSSVELGELVVFCDDDITPHQNWLQEIVTASIEEPNTCVFGGRIIPTWPKNDPPTWANDPFILSMGFCNHDLGEKHVDYPEGLFPFGGNFWVRRSVFANGRTYSESIGPKGTRRIMGSETSFLNQLNLEGYKARYIPNAIVEHRIKESDLYLTNLYRRAKSYGRGRAHIGEIDQHKLLTERPFTWHVRQLLKLIRIPFRLIIAKMAMSEVYRVRKLVHINIELGRIFETLKLAKKLQNH